MCVLYECVYYMMLLYVHGSECCAYALCMYITRVAGTSHITGGEMQGATSNNYLAGGSSGEFAPYPVTNPVQDVCMVLCQ